MQRWTSSLIAAMDFPLAKSIHCFSFPLATRLITSKADQPSLPASNRPPGGGQRGESTVAGHQREFVKVPRHPEELLCLSDLTLELLLRVIVDRGEPELDEKLRLLGRAEAADEAEPGRLAQAMGPPAGTVDRPFGHGEVVESGMLGGIGGV